MSEALRSVLPILHWRQSVFDLLLANVTSTAGRESRTNVIARLGKQIPDAHFQALVPCSSAGTSGGGGEF